MFLGAISISLRCQRWIMCTDKELYEEIMTNDDNLESNLLTSILLKMLVQVLLQVESEISYCVDPDADTSSVTS